MSGGEGRPAPASGGRPAAAPAVLLAVLLSGAAGLVYEVVWSRQLALVLGITAHATTAVVAAFMLGLAAGAHLLGRAADRVRRPLALFAGLEVGVALLGLVSPLALAQLGQLYARLAPESGGPGLRLAVALVALLPPTVLMGGTLPALVRGIGTPGRIAEATGRVYGLNTLGAVGGALTATFLLLPGIGLAATARSAAALNLAAAALALLAARPRRGEPDRDAPARDEPARDEPRRGEPEGGGPRPGDAPPAAHPTPGRARPSVGGPPPPQRPSRASRPLVLTVFALSGFAALAAQLAWIRALTLVVGSSVYALSLALATFLAGLALGSLLLAGVAGRALARGGGERLAVRLELGAAAATLLSLPVIGVLPGVFVAAIGGGLHQSPLGLHLFLLALAAVVLLPPTLLLGGLFPLLTALATEARRPTGEGVGAALAANGVGTVGGTLAGGLLLLPTIGVHGTLLVAAGVQLVAGLALGRAAASPRRRGVELAAAGAFLAAVLLLPRWDRMVMTSGPYVNAAFLLDAPAGVGFEEWVRRRSRLVFYEEGPDAVVTVRDLGEERLLVVNGKTDGSRLGDRTTQVLFGHLPLFLHPRPREVLVVGLGTGITAGSVARHAEVEGLTVVEVSEAVVRASLHFSEENRDVLLDPRLHLVRDDARSFLAVSERRWDAIVSEPSNPWITGVANLFTREFFAAARGHLAPDGVMAQWIHTYSMDVEDLRSVLATFTDVFPHATLWLPQMGDLLLVGSREPHALDRRRLEELLDRPAVFTDLHAVGKGTPAELARSLLLGDRELRRFTAGAPLNTDDLPRLEFSAPRNLYADTMMPNMVELVSGLGGRAQRVPLVGLVEEGAKGRWRALGLEVAAEEAPEAWWEVGWEWFLATDGEPELAVALHRRSEVVAEAGVAAEIELGHLPERPDPARLAASLGWTALPEPGPPLADGTATLVRGGAASRQLAWLCPERWQGHPRYVAHPAGGASPEWRVLATALRCAPDSDR